MRTRERLSVGAGARYIGQSHGDDVSTIEVESATLVDAAIRYQRRLGLALNASNLFDKDCDGTCYAGDGGLYGDGRNVTATMTAAF